MKCLLILERRCAFVLFFSMKCFADYQVTNLNPSRCMILQEEVNEEDIDDSFKALFAQLAGEVGLLFCFLFLLTSTQGERSSVCVCVCFFVENI